MEKALTRREQYLQAIASRHLELLPDTPLTREEALLEEIAQKAAGAGGNDPTGIDLGDYATKESVESLKTDDIGVSGATVVHDINHITLKPSTATLANGVYTYNAPTSGNLWGSYIVTDADLSEANGIANLKINVVEVSGEWNFYRIYTKASNGTKQYDVVKRISTVGEIEVAIDLNYLAVYGDYDGNGVNFAIANISHSDGNNTYTIKVNRYDTLIGEDNGLEGNTLTQVLQNIDAKAESARNNSNTDTSELATPNGDKYVLQIKNDGTLVSIPKLPSNILYIGNSLLNGFGTHGMASTTVNDDYYAKVNAYLESKGKTVTAERVHAAQVESKTTDSDVNTWITENLTSKVSNDRELVIIQLGDNVNTNEKLAEFQKSCGILCSYIRNNCPNARVAWVGMWYSSTAKINIIQEACNKYGCTFVDIHDLANVSANKGSVGDTYIDANGEEQTITESGVASHPSNLGHTQIANRIINTLFE